MGRFSISKLRNKHFLALAGNLVIAGLSLLTVAILYRSMTKADMGAWFFFLSILALGDALRNGLLGTATVKFYAGTDKKRGQEVLGSVWFLATAITVLILLIDLAFIPFIPVFKDQLFSMSIKWAGATLMSTLPTSVMFWILVAEERYGKILYLRLINNGSMIAVIIVLAIMKKMDINSLLWCNILTNLLTCAVGFAWQLGRIATLRNTSRHCVAELFHFGKYSLGTNAVAKLLSSSDIYIITFMLGPAAIAVYSLPQRLMEIVELPLRSFVGTGMSEMAAAYNLGDSRKANDILYKYIGILTYVFIPLVLCSCLFSNVAVMLLGGNKYIGTPAANIWCIFMITALTYPFDRFNGVALDIIHKPKVNFQKVILMLVINVAGDIVGISLLDNMYGAAIASFFTINLGFVFGYFKLKKYMDFSFRKIMVTGWVEIKNLAAKTLKLSPR
jgi:O-antigen/teichoic acid export membrane protein